jgi:MFS family permease
MQQLSGINVTSYYLPTVLIESVGMTNTMARLLAACNSVSYLLFSMIGIPNVERWGRRKMIMYAAAGQCFCYFMITILIRYTEGNVISQSAQDKVASASVAFFFLYYIFFGIGFQGVPWLYVSTSNLQLHREPADLRLANRDKWTRNAQQRCSARYCHELDLQLVSLRPVMRGCCADL